MKRWKRFFIQADGRFNQKQAITVLAKELRDANRQLTAAAAKLEAADRVEQV